MNLPIPPFNAPQDPRTQEPGPDVSSDFPLSPNLESLTSVSPLYWSETIETEKGPVTLLHFSARWQPGQPLRGLCREVGSGQEPTKISRSLLQLRQALVQLFPGTPQVPHGFRSGCHDCDTVGLRLSECYQLLSRVNAQLFMTFPKLGYPTALQLEAHLMTTPAVPPHQLVLQEPSPPQPEDPEAKQGGSEVAPTPPPLTQLQLPDFQPSEVDTVDYTMTMVPPADVFLSSTCAFDDPGGDENKENETLV